MKKILHLLASNKFSGAENVVCTIIEKCSNEYDMAYCSVIGPIEKVLKKKNINYYGIEKLNVRNLKKIIQLYNPDIIHAHDYTASIVAAFSGFNGKIISHLHINALFARSINVKSLLYFLSIHKYEHIVGVSDSVINEAIFKNSMKKKYLTIYNYVDKQNIIDKSKSYSYSKKYDLFFIGRLNELKNPLDFIEIVYGVKQKKSDVSAVIIGDGELKEKCEQLIKKYDLQDNIFMLGFVDNPFPIIKNCVVGIMPSKVEGFGITAIESMILNKPVLNSGVGGLGEIFKNDVQMICANCEYVDKALDIIGEDVKYNFGHIVNVYCDVNNWKINLIRIYT